MRAAAVIVLVAVLALPGCVSVREVPPPIGDAELQSYLEARVDAAWANTGLDGTVERPESDPATLVARYSDTGGAEDQSDCLVDFGITTWGVSEKNGGPVFTTGDDSAVEPSVQLSWYTCFAAHPTNSTFFGVTLSRAQADYLYDYYQEWVLPCLTLAGYSVNFVPSRADYVEHQGFGWVPYYALEAGLSGEDPYADGGAAMYELADRCGTPFPGMPYGEQYGF